jgi:hypothetical protein
MMFHQNGAIRVILIRVIQGHPTFRQITLRDFLREGITCWEFLQNTIGYCELI